MSHSDQHSPTATMRFRWPWRPYQERVLADLEAHLEDHRLHVVAAPGSGKTILGIEAFRRLGKPAVVLSPTLTIRNQWLRRLSDFLPEGGTSPPDWTSKDLTSPGYFTSITYQALHTQYRASAAIEDAPSAQELVEIAAIFREARVATLILDEAHHLRQAWWKALETLVDQLPDVHLISLTATPPFDVLGAEWERYEELCGPITTEVSVPELVKTNALCAHQDFVHIVWAASDAADIADYDRRIAQLLRDLTADSELIDAAASHPWIKAPDPDPKEILEDPELAFALLIFLKHCGMKPAFALLELLGCQLERLPAWDCRWCHVLVRGYLRDGFGLVADEHRKELTRRLRREGMLWRGELRIASSRLLERQLSLAEEKIEGCIRICVEEWDQRGEALRQTILCDFIADDDFDRAPAPERRLGAWPLFRALIDALPAERAERVALVTGRLAVVHSARVEALDAGIEATSLATRPAWMRLRADGHPVGALTRMLTAGDIQVLVGTRSLLGEGWDAPAVNSLVLASYVGSYMLTNQMRGRAIRTDPNAPNKIASIWHLAAVTDAPLTGRSDLEVLSERCRTFVGLHVERPAIESGFARLALPGELTAVNDEMFARLTARDDLRRQWAEAIEAGDYGRVVPSVLAGPQQNVRHFVFSKTLRALVYPALQILALIVMFGLRTATELPRVGRAVVWILAATVAVALVAALVLLFRPLRIWL